MSINNHSRISTLANTYYFNITWKRKQFWSEQFYFYFILSQLLYLYYSPNVEWKTGNIKSNLTQSNMF